MASRLVDLDVKDADLRQTLEKIARQASINIIVSPKVSGKITCLVNQMDARELIFFLARANGLEVEDNGPIIIVMVGKSASRKQRVEVISLQYASSAEVAKMIQSLRQDKSVSVTHDERTNRLILVYDE
jgi:type II secretory pathway component GspD/PulD (secretin)